MAGGENLSGSDESSLLASINITPFVDVVLVLLVIFMVTTPILMKDLLDIHLPKTKSADGPHLNTLGIVINKDAQILLNGALISEQDLQLQIKKSLQENKDTQAVISADTELNYGTVVKLIDLIKTSGLDKFALQIEKITPESSQTELGH